jgi:catechol 2,3-dioxygenase-like lactoylglutathione lyase family enzyme
VVATVATDLRHRGGLVLETSEAVAFLPSADLERSERFFQDVLNLELVSRSPFASVFQVSGGTLRVTKVDELRPQPFTVFGWLVADLRAVVRDLRDREIDMIRYEGLDQDDDGIWTTPGGDLVAWFHDPDANVLSLTELVHA